jgi:hypothetical protein
LTASAGGACCADAVPASAKIIAAQKILNMNSSPAIPCSASLVPAARSRQA